MGVARSQLYASTCCWCMIAERIGNDDQTQLSIVRDMLVPSVIVICMVIYDLP